MSGGNPAEARQEDDFYPTPPEPTIALLRRYNFGKRVIHECAAGDLAMASVIEQFGYAVVASDLVLRTAEQGVIQQDFLTLEKPLAPVVITNPPFNLAAKFIEHGMGELQLDGLALLLKSTFFHASTRLPLFERFKPKVVAPLTWRPDFLGKGRPTMDVSWFIWMRGNENYPVYRPLRKPEAPQITRAIM